MTEAAPVILLVHGLGLKQGEEQELAKWKGALDRHLAHEPGYAAAQLRMAYYSDELHPEVRVARATRSPRAGRDGGSDTSATPPAHIRAAEDRVVEALVARYWEYDAGKRRERAAAEVEAGESGDGGRPAGPVPRGRATAREVTQLPTVELGPDETYHTFVRDIMKYFGLAHREPVNAKLAAQLDAVPPGAPVLLLSHSLGTIVAYDVLTAGSHKVDTWITLGSPLGYAQDLQAQIPRWLAELDAEHLVRLAGVGAQAEEAMAWISSTIDVAKQRIDGFFASLRRAAPRAARGVYALPAPRFPDGKVERWYNLYDPTDPVAAPRAFGDPTLADEYLSEGRQRVLDIAIANAGGHPHGEVGYLEALQTVLLVKDFLLRQQAHA